MGDKDLDEYRRALSAIVLPEMVFHLNRVELLHEASGTVIAFNALDALAGWKLEDLPPLQVRVAEEWRKAREQEIQQQKAVQLTYDWTYTTPYTCTVISAGSVASSGAADSVSAPGSQPAAALAASGQPLGGSSPGPSPAPSTSLSPRTSQSGSGLVVRQGVPDFVCGGGRTAASGPAATATSSTATAGSAPGPAAPAANGGGGAVSSGPDAAGGPVGASAAAAAADGDAGCCVWQPTSDQIDRGLLMERDPILFYDEIPLYESDLDDNGVCAVTVKLRVMPRCWLVLLRLWVRVDGSMVRLRETRLFCRHDKPDKRLEVLQEVKHCEGTFSELRSRGAPDEGPAYSDADAASQVFQAVAPVGLKLLQTRKLRLPASPAQRPTPSPAPAPGPATCPPPAPAH